MIAIFRYMLHFLGAIFLKSRRTGSGFFTKASYNQYNAFLIVYDRISDL